MSIYYIYTSLHVKYLRHDQYHAEPNILLTRNLIFDSDVIQ